MKNFDTFIFPAPPRAKAFGSDILPATCAPASNIVSNDKSLSWSLKTVFSFASFGILSGLSSTSSTEESNTGVLNAPSLSGLLIKSLTILRDSESSNDKAPRASLSSFEGSTGTRSKFCSSSMSSPTIPYRKARNYFYCRIGQLNKAGSTATWRDSSP